MPPKRPSLALTRPRPAQLAIALLAALGYGGWAWLSNCQGDPHVALRAMLIQGSYSALLTLANVVVLESVFARLTPQLQWRSNLAATLSAATILQYAVIVPIHWLNRTPEIVLTLLPGIVIGSIFSAIYLLAIRRRYYPASQMDKAG